MLADFHVVFCFKSCGAFFVCWAMLLDKILESFIRWIVPDGVSFSVSALGAPHDNFFVL